MNLFRAKRIPSFALLFASLLLFSCGGTKDMVTDTIDEERVLDTMVVTPDARVEVDEDEIAQPFRATFNRSMDLIHTDLSVSFDFEKRAVMGEAMLTMEPLFYAQSDVIIDAKDFDIHSVKVDGKDLKYEYNDEQIMIDLGKTYKKGEPVYLAIDYTAFPYRSAAGGSAAITSDRGLYFIDPDNTDPWKPTQIWTQGETESSSRWFPTIDKPNERHTHNFMVRVPTAYRTLSNGKLTKQQEHQDSTRTDTWVMDQSHAPYLAMLAIGEFHTEDDKWNEVPLEYIVEEAYADEAKEIFNHTPEMLTFFSDKLDYPYPWNKYSQVVVRDYVSGAMENTTASLYGQFLQRPKGDLIDNGNDRIVAHEMFHHWFGDLVTCESWANLTLNEGFANYSEYLWLAHKYGKDEGEWHRYTELQGYLGQAAQQVHPLIHHHYQDKEDMFDAHSYNKGGMVLHMLRHIVGDDAFFTSLNRYLNKMEYKAAEVHDLRLTFEEVTGLDLQQFFHQWFLSPGHPELSVDVDYLAEQGELVVNVDQTQTSKRWRVFTLPTELLVVMPNGVTERMPIHIHEKTQAFRFPMDKEPSLVLFDPDHIQLATVVYEDAPNLAANFDHLTSVWDRMEALNALETLEGMDHQVLASKGLADDAWQVREKTLQLIKEGTLTSEQFRQIATDDEHAKVRVAAIRNTPKPILAEVKLWSNDPSNLVRAAAALRLLTIDRDKALAWADAQQSSRSLPILAAVASIYAQTEVEGKQDFFNGPATDALSGYEEQFEFYGSWGQYMAKASEETAMLDQVETWVDKLADPDADLYKKYAMLTAVGQLAENVDKETMSAEGKTRMGNLMQKFGMAAASLFQ